MTEPAFRAAVTNTGGNSVAIVIPGGPTGVKAKDGMLLVAFANTDCAIAKPDGWQIAKAQESAEATGITAAVFQRIASATDPGSTITLTNDGITPKAGALLLAYSGVDPTDLIHKILSRLDTGGTLSVPSPALTTTINGCRVVEVYVGKASSTTAFTGLPAGGTSRAALVGTGGGHADAAAVDRAAADAGAYGGGNFVLDANQSSAITYTIAVAPLPTAQRLLPQTDVTTGGYTAEPAAVTGVALAARIGESVRDDATYLRSPVGPTGAVYEARLNAGEDPGVDTGMSFLVVLSSGGGATTAECEVALVQGTTVISAHTYTGLTDAPTAYTFNVPDTDVVDITDFGDLRLRFTSTAS